MTTSATPNIERIRIPHDLELLDHQKATIAARLQGYRWRAACDHRQSGKDLEGLVDIASAAVHEPGVYAYIAPTYTMVRNICWDGIRGFDGRPYLSVIPEELIADKNEAELSLMLRTQHPDKLSRILFLSGDNADRLRGLPLKGVVITEYAQFEGSAVLDVVRPSLNASGGWLLVLSTPLGIGNHFHQLWTMAKASPDWWTASRTIEDTHYLDGRPMVAKADVERELREGQRED